MIPARAIEAAARELVAGADTRSWLLWDDYTAFGQEELRKQALLILEAAAPHIQGEATADALRAAWDRGYATAIDGMKDIPAQAWDEGRKHGATYPYGERGLATDDNPYRSAP